MFHTPDTHIIEEHDLTDPVERRRAIAAAAAAPFGDDRLALVAAWAREGRAARHAALREQAVTEIVGREPMRHRPAPAIRPLLAD